MHHASLIVNVRMEETDGGLATRPAEKIFNLWITSIVRVWSFVAEGKTKKNVQKILNIKSSVS